jgi:hypothetical protein
MSWSTGSTLEHRARVALGLIDRGIDGLVDGGGATSLMIGERRQVSKGA